MDAGTLTAIVVGLALFVDFVIRVTAVIVVPRNRKPTSATGSIAQQLRASACANPPG